MDPPPSPTGGGEPPPPSPTAPPPPPPPPSPTAPPPPPSPEPPTDTPTPSPPGTPSPLPPTTPTPSPPTSTPPDPPTTPTPSPPTPSPVPPSGTSTRPGSSTVDGPGPSDSRTPTPGPIPGPSSSISRGGTDTGTPDTSTRRPGPTSNDPTGPTIDGDNNTSRRSTSTTPPGPQQQSSSYITYPATSTWYPPVENFPHEHYGAANPSSTRRDGAWTPQDQTVATYLAAQTGWSRTTYEGRIWVQTTLQAPYTVVYTRYTTITTTVRETPTTTTTVLPVTSVIPPGTVIITHNLSSLLKKSSSKVPIIGGAVGGAVLLLTLLGVFFFVRRHIRRKREREGLYDNPLDLSGERQGPPSPTRVATDSAFGNSNAPGTPSTRYRDSLANPQMTQVGHGGSVGGSYDPYAPSTFSQGQGQGQAQPQYYGAGGANTVDTRTIASTRDERDSTYTAGVSAVGAYDRYTQSNMQHYPLPPTHPQQQAQGGAYHRRAPSATGSTISGSTSMLSSSNGGATPFGGPMGTMYEDQLDRERSPEYEEGDPFMDNAAVHSYGAYGGMAPLQGQGGGGGGVGHMRMGSVPSGRGVIVHEDAGSLVDLGREGERGSGVGGAGGYATGNAGMEMGANSSGTMPPLYVQR